MSVGSRIGHLRRVFVGQVLLFGGVDNEIDEPDSFEWRVFSFLSRVYNGTMNVIKSLEQFLAQYLSPVAKVRASMGVILIWSCCAVAGESELPVSERLLGSWQPESDTDVIVTIGKRGDGFQGYVSDHRNHAERAVGVHTLRDFKFDPETSHWHGQVYAAKMDKLLDGVIQHPNADAFQLQVRLGFFKRSVIWRRMPAAKFSKTESTP